MAYLLWQYLTDSTNRFPSAPAVTCRGEILSYQDLHDQSTRFANMLAVEGIGRGCRVGLYMTKSVYSVVAMLGILKAGAAYVPVDPNAPPRRAAFILSDCAVTGLVSTTRAIVGLREFATELKQVNTVILAEEQPGFLSWGLGARIHHWGALAHADSKRLLAAPGVESDPAYLLYTSGSTGKPKGVIISHRNAITFVEWGAATFAVSPEDRLSNHAPLHFDLSVFDIYAALRCGACVVMVPEEVTLFPIELAGWIDAERITIWYSVPSALVRLLLHGQPERFGYQALRCLLFAGEVFPAKHLQKLIAMLPHVAFYNLYGPTETNVCSFYRIPQTSVETVSDIPIGQACANTEVFAVNEEDRLIRPGEVGELLVRGPSVMLGYWGLPEKTAQAMVTNPLQFAYHERVYRTGDYVRLRHDGHYDFLGRKDHMVKSRGYRIELGEIEVTLYQHAKVREAVALALPDEEIGARLVAVVVCYQDQEVSSKDLGEFCRSRLPNYMVPEEFVFRDELPQTSTGKTDRLALRDEVQRSRAGGQLDTELVTHVPSEHVCG